jgi:16S rRNA (adenine1518-N6/adenine1519-N6)-dimethyltransferase
MTTAATSSDSPKHPAGVDPNAADELRAAARRLRARFRREGLRTTKQLGQHFLADLNLARKVVQLLPPPSAGPVLEIGPGLGALTFLLLESGYRVIAVEIDPRLASWLSQALAPWSQAEVRQGDIRALNLAELAGESQLQIIGNLPYYATSEILFQLLAARRLLGDSVLTMQREVAERLTAPPGSRAYGALSATIGLRATVESCLRLPATAFWPAPDVDSTTVRLRWRAPATRVDAVPDRLLERVVRAAFAQRRKRMENSLAAALGIERSTIAELVERAGIPAGARAEEVAPRVFAELALAFAAILEPAADDTPPTHAEPPPDGGLRDGRSA